MGFCYSIGFLYEFADQIKGNITFVLFLPFQDSKYFSLSLIALTFVR